MAKFPSVQELRSLVVVDEMSDATVEKPQYTDKEAEYLGAIRRRFMRARDERDTNHEPFDGMTYIERCRSNRRLANSFIRPRQNKGEVTFTTGTSRRKLMVQLASLINLNLQPDIMAFDGENVPVATLGEAVEDIDEKCRELDNDQEKKLQRLFTLLEQGEVFVETLHKDPSYVYKALIGKFAGKFRDVEIVSSVRPSASVITKNVIQNEKVYLGNISKYPIKGPDGQPFLFTVEHKDYREMELLFKDFEMFKYVEKSMTGMYSVMENAITGYLPYWQLIATQKGKVEVVKYQSSCHFDNEFQVLINGIPMFPIGFPITEISPDGDYLLDMQVLELIDAQFAYGRSLMQTLRGGQEVEDEFWRAAIFKTQQSYKPPMVNNTGRALSSGVFAPGTMLSGIDAKKFVPLLNQAQTQGINNGEAMVLKLLRQNIDDNSTDPQFSGRAPEGDPTATQVNAVQLQSEKIFGLVVFVSALLEQKLTYSAIPYYLKYWFDPVDKKVDDVRKGIVDVYRSFSVEKPIDGQGMGQEIVKIVPKDEMPSDFDTFQENQRLTREVGMPVKKIYLNRDVIISTRWMWRVVVVPAPIRTSNLQKLLFKDAVQTFLFSPNFSMDWFEETAANTWGFNPRKVFNKQNALAAGMAPPRVQPDGSGANALNMMGAGGKKTPHGAGAMMG